MLSPFYHLSPQFRPQLSCSSSALPMYLSSHVSGLGVGSPASLGTKGLPKLDWAGHHFGCPASSFSLHPAFPGDHSNLGGGATGMCAEREETGWRHQLRGESWGGRTQTRMSGNGPASEVTTPCPHRGSSLLHPTPPCPRRRKKSKST